MQSLARRCNWPEAHSRQVALLSLELFDATQELHGLGPDDRELLDHAALLHDIGEHVSNAGHHRHSAYLVRNGQLRGFAPDEIELLAAMVRWHRSGDPRVSDEFPLLDADAIARVRVLTALLRIADGLDRGREQTVYGVDLMITPSLVLVRLRTRGDAELEIWGARRKRAIVREDLRPRAGAHHASCARGASLVRRARRSRMRAIPIGDEWVEDNDELVVRSPFDGHEIDRVPACDAKQVDRAVAAAAAVHREGTLPAWKRAEILDRAAQLLSERNEEFAHTIAEEAAKPIKTARVEARRAVSTFTFAAAEARALSGEMVPMDASDVGEGKLAFTLRVPVGVVGAISPFNFPLNLVAHKVAPAIAAGCPVVLKPASQTPLSAIALARLLLTECGLPPGHLNIVTGSGAKVGDPLVDHDDVAMITFTGSPEVGWSIRGRAARKKVGLELGNNAPVILEPDADVDTAAKKISVAGFSHAGQSCISTQRVYVHESVAAKLLGELVPLVEALVVGDPLDDATDVSSLISTRRHGAGCIVDRRSRGGRRDGRLRRDRARRHARAHRAHRGHARHEGVLRGGLRPGGGGADLHRGRRRAAARERLALRAPGRDLHQRPVGRAPGRARARLRGRARQRGARRTAPIRCPTAVCATAGTPARGRGTRCTR